MGFSFNPNDYRSLAKVSVACACCGSTRHSKPFVGDRYNFGLHTVLCLDCGLIFTNPRPDADWFREFYQYHYRQFYECVKVPDKAYLQRDWTRGRHMRNVDLLSQFVAAKGTLLDIGCAEGTFLSIFQDRFPNWTLYGIEPSEDFSQFARTHYGLAGILTGNFEQLPDLFPAESFDVITASHVLEHILVPETLFRIARTLLRPGGLLFIDVPDVEGASRGINNFHIGHVYHFTENALENFFCKFGFEKVTNRKGLDVPVPWTFQAIGRKMESVPDQWKPKSFDNRKAARMFERYSKPSLLRVFRRKIAAIKKMWGPSLVISGLTEHSAICQEALKTGIGI